MVYQVKNQSGEAQLNSVWFTRTDRTSLIVVPASLVHNCKRIRKFAPSLQVYTHTGKERAPGDWSRYHYPQATIRCGRISNSLSGFSVPLYHSDESQVIKIKVKIYKTVESLKSQFRSGTQGPLLRISVDLWRKDEFCQYEASWEPDFFKKEFTIPIEKKNKQDKEDKLENLIRPSILRRKREVKSTNRFQSRLYIAA
ncbi:MAG: hypothetical protein H6540_07900 [Bacteroidales bacterium]|nr:hypothetical protein [Bacteroidales bacterium]